MSSCSLNGHGSFLLSFIPLHTSPILEGYHHHSARYRVPICTNHQFLVMSESSLPQFGTDQVLVSWMSWNLLQVILRSAEHEMRRQLELKASGASGMNKMWGLIIIGWQGSFIMIMTPRFDSPSCSTSGLHHDFCHLQIMDNEFCVQLEFGQLWLFQYSRGSTNNVSIMSIPPTKPARGLWSSSRIKHTQNHTF